MKTEPRTFVFLDRVFDLDKAREILIAKPRPARQLKLTEAYGMASLVKVDATRARAIDHLDMDPVTTAWVDDWGRLELKPGRIVIDGWHRVWNAIYNGYGSILAVDLDKEESKEVRLDE